MHTEFPGGALYKWQDGTLHFALVQLNDREKGDPVTSVTEPTFSTPIGTLADPNVVPLTQSTLHRTDLVHASLKSPDYKVITHRKYFLGNHKPNSNRVKMSDIKMYIPCKKMVQFTEQTDTHGTRPFKILMWYVPKNAHYEEVRTITVSNISTTAYFKNKLM